MRDRESRVEVVVNTCQAKSDASHAILRKNSREWIGHASTRRGIEPIQRLGFAREPRQAVGVVRERVGQDLDRHLRSSLVSRARKKCPMSGSRWTGQRPARPGHETLRLDVATGRRRRVTSMT